MTTYAVKRINIKNKNVGSQDYWDAVRNTSIHYCNGIKELREYCGGHLHYSYNAKAYMGINGNIEYVAEKIRG